MRELWVEGGRRLSGSIKVQGSKNAALPLLSAALLTAGEVSLERCPRITDVEEMRGILSSLGARTAWDNGTLRIACRGMQETVIGREATRTTRASVLFMGSLLARTGKARIAPPGGCSIGKRPIGLHLDVLRALGARIGEADGVYLLDAGAGLRGVSYTFPRVSVGATENAILAAAGARGETRLKNCAAEPEIGHLCRFLETLGVSIEGIGSSELTIRGRTGGLASDGVRFRVPADRIAAGTYLAAALATRGTIALLDAPVGEMGAVLEAFRSVGGKWEARDGALWADARVQAGFRSVSLLETACYPGFPTDMQPIFAAALLTVPGESRIRETVFEERFGVFGELTRMGAEIKIEKDLIRIDGGRPLHGACVCAGDLRGAAALMVAGLAADGCTCIRRADYLERGYEGTREILESLGGICIPPGEMGKERVNA